MSSNQQYLTSDDMTMIERVLEQAGLRKSEAGSMMDRNAASFLTHKFQDGVTSEAEMALALDQYIKMRGAWRSSPQGTDAQTQQGDWSPSHQRQRSRL